MYFIFCVFTYFTVVLICYDGLVRSNCFKPVTFGIAPDVTGCWTEIGTRSSWSFCNRAGASDTVCMLSESTANFRRMQRCRGYDFVNLQVSI